MSEEQRETPAAPAPRKPLMTAEKTAELARLRRSFDDAEARGDAEAMLEAAKSMTELESDENLDLAAEKCRKVQAWQVFGLALHAASTSTRALRIHTARRKALEKRLAAAEARTAKDAEKIESLERRASRHADHLARLESRTKALEQR